MPGDNDAMQYAFPPDVRALVDAHLASGQFSSEDAILREALGALERRRRGLDELRQMIAEADDDIDSGRVGEFDIDATMARIESRHLSWTLGGC